MQGIAKEMFIFVLSRQNKKIFRGSWGIGIPGYRDLEGTFPVSAGPESLRLKPAVGARLLARSMAGARSRPDGYIRAGRAIPRPGPGPGFGFASGPEDLRTARVSGDGRFLPPGRQDHHGTLRFLRTGAPCIPGPVSGTPAFHIASPFRRSRRTAYGCSE